MHDLYFKKFLVATVFCLTILSGIFSLPHTGDAQVLSSARRLELEEQLKALETQMAAQQQILGSKQQESASLQRDIAILDAKIKEARLAIRARDLTIEKLSDDINNKAAKIGELDSKLEREKESLGQILRKANEIDSYSITEFALGNKTLSEFFVDLDTFDTIKKEMQGSFTEIGITKDQKKKEKNTLEDKKSEQLELRRIQELQKRAIEKQEAEKQALLKSTKGQEKVYQQILAQTQKSAATIRSALFALSGAGAIPFEKALQFAVEAGSKTGLRPAFILGIIAEESNLGENVGTGNWKVDMHPTRDQPVFAQIAAKLGLNPDELPVSKKAWYGWGGAMGPAQFIPSTWVLYEDRVATLTGSNPANPWNPRDAFFASATLLRDNGGARGTRADERLAALRYLAGWKNATKPAYAFYGNEVMALADKYQEQIDILSGN